MGAANKRMNLGAYYQKFGIIVILVVEILFFSFAHQNFLTANNLLSVGRQISFIGIAAVGMTIVMLTGGIDISVGSMLALTGVLSAKFNIEMGFPLGLAIVMTLVIGVFFGLINGIAVARFKVPPLIATLAMQTILKGFAFLITKALPISGMSDTFKMIGQGYIFGFIPIPLLLMVICFVFGWWYLNTSYMGRRIYAVGGNEEAARLSGINTKMIIIIAYCLCGLFAALAGVLMAGRLGSGQPGIGADFPMDVLTATVLGGVSVSGGKGQVLNVFFGAFIMGILSNGMVMMGLSEYWQWVAKGVVLLVVVAASNVGMKKN